MYDSRYVTMMLDWLVCQFIQGAYRLHEAPNVVDCTALDDTTLELTMTDESVFLVRVEPLPTVTRR